MRLLGITNQPTNQASKRKQPKKALTFNVAVPWVINGYFAWSCDNGSGLPKLGVLILDIISLNTGNGLTQGKGCSVIAVIQQRKSTLVHYSR